MKAEWTAAPYNFYYLRFCGFTVTVGWDGKDEGGYKVSFEDRNLVKRYKSLDEAKAAGVRFARQRLQEAIAALGAPEKPGLQETAVRLAKQFGPDTKRGLITKVDVNDAVMREARLLGFSIEDAADIAERANHLMEKFPLEYC